MALRRIGAVVTQHLILPAARQHVRVAAGVLNVQPTELLAWGAAGEGEGGVPVELGEDVVDGDVGVHEGD